MPKSGLWRHFSPKEGKTRRNPSARNVYRVEGSEELQPKEFCQDGKKRAVGWVIGPETPHSGGGQRSPAEKVRPGWSLRGRRSGLHHFRNGLLGCDSVCLS